MKMTRCLITLALLLAAPAAAMAQNSTTLWNQNVGDMVFPMTPSTIGDPVWGGLAPVNGPKSYSKAVPVTGFSYYFNNFQGDMLFEPTGTLAAGYVTLAPSPPDGEPACLFSTAQVTAFYLYASAGQSINNAITEMLANVRYCYRYSLGNATWDRSQ